LAQVKAKDPQLGADLEREFKVLSARRAFGLNFERHRPEAVELPQTPVRKGDKVRLLAAPRVHQEGRSAPVASDGHLGHGRGAHRRDRGHRRRRPRRARRRRPIWWWWPSFGT
jgi:hypothetical protein